MRGGYGVEGVEVGALCGLLRRWESLGHGVGRPVASGASRGWD